MEKDEPQANTKIELLCQRLRALAREKGPGSQLPTTRDLRRLLNTTHVTLNEALGILETERIIYRKRRQGIFVASEIYHKSIHILFASNNFAERASPFWSTLWIVMEQETQRRSAFKDEIYTFHLVNPLANPEYSIPEHIDTLLRNERIDGILTVGLHIHNRELLAGKIPYVAFAGEGAHEVVLDYNEMVHLAIERLVQQGCEKIGIWVQHFPFTQLEEREDVGLFRQTLLEHKKALYPDFIRTSHGLPGQKPFSLQEQGYLLAKEVFTQSRATWPDGLLIANDMMTDGALVAFEELNISVGKDIQLVTHANVDSPILFGRTKNMTAIEFSPTLIAQVMFSLLETIMTAPPSSKQIILIRPQIRQES
jgi:DNA-binding LacI/PurR family transcriptional regulator